MVVAVVSTSNKGRVEALWKWHWSAMEMLELPNLLVKMVKERMLGVVAT
jgi:hypothetical protein